MTIRRTCAILLISLVAATPASAECPTREALESGQPAYVTYPDEAVVELRWLSGGKVQETTRYPDASEEFRMISYGGVFIVDEVDLVGDEEVEISRITTTYDGSLTDHFPLASNLSVSLNATNAFADGTAPEEERVEVETGDPAEITVAGCSYRGLPLLLTYHWEDEQFTSMMTYLPELGISLELVRLDLEQDPIPFAPVRFSLAPR